MTLVILLLIVPPVCENFNVPNIAKYIQSLTTNNIPINLNTWVKFSWVVPKRLCCLARTLFGTTEVPPVLLGSPLLVGPTPASGSLSTAANSYSWCPVGGSANCWSLLNCSNSLAPFSPVSSFASFLLAGRLPEVSCSAPVPLSGQRAPKLFLSSFDTCPWILPPNLVYFGFFESDLLDFFFFLDLMFGSCACSWSYFGYCLLACGFVCPVFGLFFYFWPLPASTQRKLVHFLFGCK